MFQLSQIKINVQKKSLTNDISRKFSLIPAVSKKKKKSFTNSPSQNSNSPQYEEFWRKIVHNKRKTEKRFLQIRYIMILCQEQIFFRREAVWERGWGLGV